jgi:hypothetical protein
MFRYRLHLEDGSDAGEATYAQTIGVGEEIIAGSNQLPCQRGNEHSQQVPVETFTLIAGRLQCEQVGRCFVIPIGRAMRLLSA